MWKGGEKKEGSGEGKKVVFSQYVFATLKGFLIQCGLVGNF